MCRRVRNAGRVVVLLSGFSAACPALARAQLLDQYFPVGAVGRETWFSDAVLDRQRSEYDALGVRVGNLSISPAVSQSFGYDSNFLGLHQPVGSTLSETQASVAASTNWSRASLGASASVDQLQYLQHPSASHTNWSVGLAGGVDIGADRLDLTYAHLSATTGAVQVGALQVGQPVAVAYDSARATYETTFGRFTLKPSLEADISRYAAGSGAAGFDPSANGNNQFIGAVTGGYTLAPGSSLVLVISDSSTSYPIRTPGLPSQNFNDIAVVGGIDYRSGLLFRYRATVGYDLHSYASSQYAASSVPIAEFDVIWTPTRLTTVTGQLSRAVASLISTGPTPTSAVAAGNATNNGGGSGSFTETTARLQIDHEYLRNVLLQGYGEFQNAALNTHGETQRIMSVGGNVTWLINRQISVVGRVSYVRSSDSTSHLLDVTDTVAELTLNFHL